MSLLFGKKVPQEKLIILVILAFTLYALIFINQFGVNVPIYDDWQFVPFVVSVYDGKPIWELDYLLQVNVARPIVPQLLMAFNTIVFSWNAISQMYIGLVFLSLTSLVYYFLLKKTNSQLYWLAIPITAFVLTTSQYQNLLWGYTAVMFPVVITTAILSIFFVNKNEKSYYLFLSIIFAFIASFTQVVGLLTWLICFPSIFYHYRRKIHSIIWIASAVFCFLLYFSDFNFQEERTSIQWEMLTNLDFMGYFIALFANGLIPNLNILNDLRVILGIPIFLMILLGPIYLKLNKFEVRKLLPWIQIGAIGLFSLLIISLGRFEVTPPFASRYITLSVIGQIASLFFASTIYLHAKSHNKKILSLLMLSFIIILIVALGVSYYSGWVGGSHMLKETSHLLDCITNPNYNLACYYMAIDPITLKEDLKLLKERNLGLFSSWEDKQDYPQFPLLNDENWKGMKTLDGNGEITSLLNKPISSMQDFSMNKETMIVPIIGWGTLQNDKVESVYIFVDDNVNSKADYGYIKRITKDNMEFLTYSEWRGVIDLRNLSEGCHDITIRLVSNASFYEIKPDTNICLN